MGVVIATGELPVSSDGRPVHDLDPCRVRGCAWWGCCPDHSASVVEPDSEVAKLMRLRPFGAGRKHQRSPARYDGNAVVKSKVTMTSIEQRRANPPKPASPCRGIPRPEPAAYEPSPADDGDRVPDPAPVVAVVVEPAELGDPVVHGGDADEPVSVVGPPAGPTPAIVARLVAAKQEVRQSQLAMPGAAIPRARRGRLVSESLPPQAVRRRGRWVRKAG
jgi:hypothetical protein